MEYVHKKVVNMIQNFCALVTQELKFYWLNPFSVVAVSISSKREEVCFETQHGFIRF